mgnify:CR=1 FL=1
MNDSKMLIPKYWNSSLFDSFDCEVDDNNQKSEGRFLVKGKVSSNSSNGLLKYIASSPPDFRTSYTGSGLPFPNTEIAYQNTPNKGAVKMENGEFSIYINYPNSFYLNQGTMLLPPHVLVKVCDDNDDNVEIVQLGESIPHRTLTSNTFTRSNFKDKVWPMDENVNPDYFH